jgi:hypothetical protein
LINAFLPNLIAGVELSFVFAVRSTKVAILEAFSVTSADFHERLLALKDRR